MLVFSLVNLKGGVTKTTTAVNLSSAFAELGYRTMLVDMDAQGHCCVHLGIDRIELAKNGDINKPVFMDQILGNRELKISDILIKTRINNLFLAPCSLEMTTNEKQLLGKPSNDSLLFRSFNGIASNIDIAVIDSPPNLGLHSLNSIYASDFIIVPCKLDRFSLEGLDLMVDTIVEMQDAYRERDIQILNVLINIYNKTTVIENRENEQTLKDVFGGNIFETRIRTNEKIKTAQRQGFSIFEMQKNDPMVKKAIVDYTCLAKEILENPKVLNRMNT